MMSTKKDRDLLQKHSSAELDASVVTLRSKLETLRMQKRIGQLANVASLWKARKELARTLTRLSALGQSARRQG